MNDQNYEAWTAANEARKGAALRLAEAFVNGDTKALEVAEVEYLEADNEMARLDRELGEGE